MDALADVKSAGPPNPRVQRTRSSPSARHEPLTRSLLGAIIGFLGAITAASWLLGGEGIPDRYFIRFNSSWESPPPEAELDIRTAEATIILLKHSGEFVEHSCLVIETPDKRWEMSPGDGHVVAAGTWRQQGRRVLVRRESIYRTVWPVGGGPDPLCGSAAVDFEITRDSLVQGERRFDPTSRIDPTAFERYAASARASRVRCGA